MACETLRDHNGWMVAVAAVVLLAWNSVDAAEPATTFTHLGAEDGLPSPTVWAVAQDSRGFMWFGTSSGLARYDGLEMLVYRHDPQDPRSLIHDDISALLVDRAGTLWVGTAAGLSRYDPGTDSFNRFVRLDPNSGHVTRHQHNPDNPASLSNDFIWAIHVDGTGRIWIGTNGSGLDRFDPAQLLFEHIELGPALASERNQLDNIVRAILQDRAGALWVGLQANDSSSNTITMGLVKKVILSITSLPQYSKTAQATCGSVPGKAGSAATIRQPANSLSIELIRPTPTASAAIG
jgi:ligand-binding sensor domain-containing protein